MLVVENARAPEVPWRPGYRYFSLAGKDQGIACVVSQAIVQPGAGAPLHVPHRAERWLVGAVVEIEHLLVQSAPQRGAGGGERWDVKTAWRLAALCIEEAEARV